MKEFLDKFSLSFILRQFFCGVVFFVPFLGLFDTQGEIKTFSLNKWIQGGFFNDWSTPKIAVLCILSCVIGTIIYHIEKNAYSYFTQSVIVYLDCKSKFLWVVCGIGVMLILLICFTCTINTWWLLFALLFCAACRGALDERTVTYTLRQWVTEQMNENQAVFNSYNLVAFVKGDLEQVPPAAIPAIAARIAKWSDYIHCVQSCCFSFMAGSILFNCLQNSKMGLEYQIIIPICILVLEFIYDCHRYKFVRFLLSLENQQ